MIFVVVRQFSERNTEPVNQKMKCENKKDREGHKAETPVATWQYPDTASEGLPFAIAIAVAVFHDVHSLTHP